MKLSPSPICMLSSYRHVRVAAFLTPIGSQPMLALSGNPMCPGTGKISQRPRLSGGATALRRQAKGPELLLHRRTPQNPPVCSPVRPESRASRLPGSTSPAEPRFRRVLNGRARSRAACGLRRTRRRQGAFARRAAAAESCQNSRRGMNAIRQRWSDATPSVPTAHLAFSADSTIKTIGSW